MQMSASVCVDIFLCGEFTLNFQTVNVRSKGQTLAARVQMHCLPANVQQLHDLHFPLFFFLVEFSPVVAIIRTMFSDAGDRVCMLVLPHNH